MSRETKPTTVEERVRVRADLDRADRGVTHHDECWRDHPRCMARRLLDDIEERDRLLRSVATQPCSSPTQCQRPDYLPCTACETRDLLARRNPEEDGGGG